MVLNHEKKKKKSHSCDIKIVFNNRLSPESWRQFRESVISANVREHVPVHLQKPFLDKFVEAGLMAP